MLRFLIATAALAFTAPAYAQDIPPSDCLETMGGLGLAKDMADEFLAENGAGDQPANSSEPRGQNAASACLDLHEIAEEDARAFLIANLGYMLSRELRRRMETYGFDLTEIDALLVIMRDNPELDVAAYVDARPAQFDGAAQGIADETGLSLDLVLALTGGYLGMKSQEILGEAMMRGDLGGE